MTRFLLSAASTLIAVSAFACSSSDSGSSGTPAVSAAQTACSTDTRKDVYADGMTKQAGTLSIKLLQANPSPPAKGTNTITLELSDASGAPVDNATITVTPFMPDHGHGSAVVPTVTPSGGGKYAVSNVYLAMAGLWKVTFSVQVAGGAVQETAFQFCLDG
jgi:hypothetical protein